MGMTTSWHVRAWRRRLTLSLAVALTLGTGALVGTPLHAAAAETLTLTASATTVNAGTTVTLTATASPTPSGSFGIGFYEVPGSSFNYTCFSNPCSAHVTYPTAGTHTFQAQLQDCCGTIVATSNTVTVTWTGTATYTLTLSASDTQPQAGETVTVTAAASPNTPTGYHIDIWETNTANGSATVSYCWEWTPCTFTATHDWAQYSYQAFLDNDPNIELPPTPNSVLASAGPVVLTWTPPSAVYCNPPTLPIVNGSVAGLKLLLDVKAGTSQSAVCFRVDNGADNGSGEAVGGALLISATVGPTLPTALTGNSCGGAQGNTLPGPHPLVNLTVVGQPVFVDVYSGPASNGALWVCESVDGLANTVVIPVGVGPLPLVTFVPDPDSLVK